MGDIRLKDLDGYLLTAGEKANINTKGSDKKVIKGDEIPLFIKEADKLVEAGLVDANYKEVLGLNIKNSTNPVAKKVSNVLADDKDSSKRAENALFRYMDEAMTTASSRKDYLSILDEKIGSQKNDPRYVKLRGAVSDVASLMPTSYSSLDDIQDKHKDILKALKASDKKDSLHKEILKKLEDFAEVEVRMQAHEKISNLYVAEYTKKENEGLTTQELMKKVKAKLKEDKEYKDEIKDAYKDFEKTELMKQARSVVGETIEEVTGETTRRGVRNAAKEELKENNTWDKYTKKALKQNRLKETFEGIKTFGRVKAEAQAIENNVEAKKIQTKEEVLDFLGDKNEVYESLVSQGLIKEDGDKVDLSLLSDLIGLQVGSDGKMNRRAKIDKAISEKFRTMSAVAVAAKLESLTEKEAQKLAKLCGYEKEGKDWGRVLMGAVSGFLTGTAMGAAATRLTPQQSVFIKKGSFNNNLTINISGDITKDMIGDLPEGVVVEETTAGLVIKISQMIKKPDTTIKLARLTNPIAWKTGLMGAAIGALDGLENKGEVPATVTNFSETDYEKYIERTKLELYRTDNADLITSITCLASAFINKDGSWDKAGYLEALNMASGDGGKLNREELLVACKSVLEKIKIESNIEEPVKEDEHSYNLKDIKGSEPEYKDVPTIDARRSSWSKLAEQYDCLGDINIPEEYKNCTRRRVELPVRMLKVAQAITDGNYSAERLLELAEATFASKNSKYENLKDFNGIDHSVLVNIMNADWLSDSVKMPDVLAGCNRTEKSIIAERANNEDAKDKPVQSANDRIKIKDGSSAKYYAKYDNGNWIEYPDMKTRNDAVADFKKKYPNAKIEKRNNE